MQNLLLPISITLALIGYALIARLYLFSWIRKVDSTTAQTALIVPHIFRYVGLSFLIPGVTATALDPRFSEPAAYGDLASAVLALIAVLMLINSSRHATKAVWIFNLVGFFDLIIAVTLGVIFTPDGDLGATFFIPSVIVPMLLVSHTVLFWVLLTDRHAPSPAT